MSGSKAELRANALAKRVATLRGQGVSVKDVSELVGIDRSRVRTLQLLGERLLQVQT